MCAACQRPAEAPPTITPDYDKGTGKLTRLSHDTNGNGKLDTVALMDGGRVVRVEADEDENGTVDRWEYYTSNPGQTTGAGQSADVLERVERATNRDGRVNRWEFFDAGTLTRVNEDTNGDGRVDKWEEYAQGTLTVMALDTVGRGTPDRKLVYSDGNLDHIEIDPDGSGRFQRAKP
jgi:hypothetical protein